MTSHQASGQMLGYLYQVRYALYILLNSESEQASINIEKFDDIAFSNDGDTPNALIQTKHHVKSYGDLSDSSTDLWRTLKVWIDLIKSNTSIIQDTKFIIVTTAIAPDGSAAYYLKDGESRDPTNACRLLCKVAKDSKNRSHVKYYQAFSSLSQSMIEALLHSDVVIDKSYNVLDVVSKIKKDIRYSCLPVYANRIYERLEGWWLQKSIEALCSEEPIFVSQGQVRSYINSLSSEYAPDNLPIDVGLFENADFESLPPKERLFCEQLRIVYVGKARIKLAIRDYYRAYTQRTNWIKDHLLYINDLEKYELRLVDEWEHAFASMRDELDGYGPSLTEETKEKAGRALYGNIHDKDIRIREKCSEAFVLRGSYHMLANQLRIGWHIDFYERLVHLLGDW